MSQLVREIKPYFEKGIDPFINLLERLRVSPNLITLLGFTFVFIGSIFLYKHMYLFSFVFLSLGGLSDAIDGALARKRGLKSPFGAFLDSLTDRFSDALPFIAIALSTEDKSLALISLLAIVFSFGVSYARARAEGLGYELRVGLFERPERWIVLLLGILFDIIPIAVFIILVGSAITLAQRVYAFKKYFS